MAIQLNLSKVSGETSGSFVLGIWNWLIFRPLVDILVEFDIQIPAEAALASRARRRCIILPLDADQLNCQEGFCLRLALFKF